MNRLIIRYESVIRTLCLVWLVICSAYSGYQVGLAFPKPQFVVNPESVFAKSRDELWQRTCDAVGTLHNCLAFQRQWTKEFRYFRHYIATHNIGISYDSGDMQNLAYHLRHTSTIFVTYSYFMLSKDEQERTLAHEFLHMAGLPRHADPLDPSKDAIYKLTDACYPDLPPESIYHER